MSRAHPGDEVGEDVCGYRADDGAYCGQAIAYRIRFQGWKPWECAGACAEHAAAARELDVARIWSVAS